MKRLQALQRLKLKDLKMNETQLYCALFKLEESEIDKLDTDNLPKLESQVK